jgi:hypothetical protein
MHRHKTCFRLPPSSRNSSSSCSTACPRLSTRAFWATGSTPSSRCITLTPHSATSCLFIHAKHTGMACPPLACGIGGGSGGARRKDHRHAARDGPGRDSAPPLLPRHGALDLAQAQHFVHTRPLARLRVVCCSYWIKSRKRKGCLALHTPTTTNPAHPTPIPAPSLLTISRHAPTLNPVQTILQPRVKKHHSYIPRISPILL